ncbi:MAG: hypothetical protein IPG00_22265 [Saprospiraceae bacterium]|nr:hypothetical protein [Saprospiraceae bacterium]
MLGSRLVQLRMALGSSAMLKMLAEFPDSVGPIVMVNNVSVLLKVKGAV